MNLAGVITVRAGFRDRLIYRMLTSRDREREKKGFPQCGLAGGV